MICLFLFGPQALGGVPSFSLQNVMSNALQIMPGDPFGAEEPFQFLVVQGKSQGKPQGKSQGKSKGSPKGFPKGSPKAQAGGTGGTHNSFLTLFGINRDPY